MKKAWMYGPLLLALISGSVSAQVNLEALTEQGKELFNRNRKYKNHSRQNNTFSEQRKNHLKQ